MAKSEQLPADKKSLISEETKGAVGDEIREKVTEKAIEVIEKAIAKLEEVLAWLKPHVEPYVSDASLHIQSAIDKLKKSKEGK